MTKRHDVTFSVAENKLGQTIEMMLATGATLVGVRPSQGIEPPSKTVRYVGGKRNKGISAMQLLLSTINQIGLTRRSEVDQAFVHNGFAQSSVSPTISKALQDQFIKMEGSGYSLTELGKLEVPHEPIS